MNNISLCLRCIWSENSKVICQKTTSYKDLWGFGEINPLQGLLTIISTFNFLIVIYNCTHVKYSSSSLVFAMCHQQTLLYSAVNLGIIGSGGICEFFAKKKELNTTKI